MAKHKSIKRTHLQASEPPPPSAPRLAAQLLVAMGELLVFAVCIVGIVTVATWILVGVEVRNRTAAQQQRGRRVVVLYDRRGGERCEREPVYRPPARRYWRDGE
jgi:hypothetical protein